MALNTIYLKLNVGCGTDIRPGFVNMDIAALPGVDVVHNIEQLPLPFASDTFSEIVCQDVLEHVDYIPILKELHRILKKDGLLHIRVPHFTSRNNYIDPTHKRMFSSRTFEFFVGNSFLGRNYYFDFAYTEMPRIRITFVKKFLFFYNHLIEPIINLKNGSRDIYEETFLSRLFPAFNIELTLKK